MVYDFEKKARVLDIDYPLWIEHAVFASTNTTSVAVLASERGEILMVDLNTGKEIGRMNFPIAEDAVGFVTPAISPDAGTIASFLPGKALCLWTVTGANQRCYDAGVHDHLIFLPDGRQLAFESLGLLTVWNWMP